MYRLLVLLVLLSVVDAKSWCRGPHCQEKRHRREHTRNPGEVFHKLAHQTISIEKKFENFCRENMYSRVRETYANDSYVLKYSIPTFQAKDFIIKVMHTVLYISAERWDPSGLQVFRDVNMLPANLNSEEASWSMQDGELVITFPYRTPLGTEARKACGNINYSYITLPMEADGNTGAGDGAKV